MVWISIFIVFYKFTCFKTSCNVPCSASSSAGPSELPAGSYRPIGQGLPPLCPTELLLPMHVVKMRLAVE